jgi:hypothetical protein
LNRTNAETIAEIAGTDDIEQWPGTALQLFATPVEFSGQRVLSIRIAAPPTEPKGGSGAPSAPLADGDDLMPHGGRRTPF